MFPNARLMAVAILAAIAGIGCGLGLFATFRVNHEPLARLADGSPPLQLALDNRLLGSDVRMPLEARLPADTAAKVISVPLVVQIASPVEQVGADAALAADGAVKESAADSAVQQRPTDTAAQELPAGAEAADQSDTTSSVVAAVSPEPSNVTPEVPAAAASQQKADAAVQDQQPASPDALPRSAVQTAAINAAAVDERPKAKAPNSAGRKTEKPARASRAAQPRRPTKVVRARRPVATAAVQPGYQFIQPAYTQRTYSQSAYAQPAYAQPAYSWTDGTAQASAPKRVVAKGHRAAQAIPAAQPNSAAATAGLNNGQ